MTASFFDKGFGLGDSLNLWLITMCLIMLALDFTCGSPALNEAAREVKCECHCGGDL